LSKALRRVSNRPGFFEGLGLAGNASAPLNLKQVLVPQQNRLGEEKSGFATMLEVVLPHFQTGCAAVSVGIANAALQHEHKWQSVCHKRYYADETMEDNSFAGILLHCRDFRNKVDS
jgi:alkylation response protein AidB-like acyl-CoA dehydrogenase